MINHHDTGLVAGLMNTLHVWRDRVRARRELAQWSARDMHDAGVSWSEMVAEADKPFWQA